jgi:hypothetical protein
MEAIECILGMIKPAPLGLRDLQNRFESSLRHWRASSRNPSAIGTHQVIG